MRTFVCFLIVASLANFTSAKKECSSDPAEWCTNIDTAKKCNVIEQCYKNVWTSADYLSKLYEKKVENSDDLVNFTLYYETLCPDCREFMSGQILKAFQEVGSIMNLTLVPYGNAKETYRSETRLWQFTCQHGTDECWGNLLHSCLIYYFPKTEDHLPFIHCMESDEQDEIRTAANKCAEQFNVTMSVLNKCMNSRLGNNIQHANAVLTEQLNPPHQYVPWVTLNDAHSEDIQNQAQDDLVALICKTYQGATKPAACNSDKKRKCMRN